MTAATVRSSGSGAEQGITDVARGYGDGSGLKPGWGVSPERQQAIADVMRKLAPQSGRLSLAPNNGGGCVFQFTLPVANEGN